jgi:hypothetical protein
MAPKVELQEFEDRAALRIKFASLRDQGPHLVPDASEEYAGFFDELPAGWSMTEEGHIETLAEHTRHARRLSSSDGDVVVVEHETGLEILVLSVGLAETAVKLVSWGWRKWKERRGETRPLRTAPQGAPGNDAVVFERTTWAPDGTRTLSRVTVPADQVSEDLILRHVTGAASQVA